MSSTFMNSSKLLFTSESVTEGHPDKICDQVSDAVLDACLAQDPYSRVACETAVKTGYVMVLGEITTKAQINYDKLIRSVINDIGYTDSDYGFDGNSCGVLVAISQQSGDIAMGVDKALEAKSGEMIEKEIESVGAGDQGMMFGFACNETSTLMPMPIYLAHKLSRRLAETRRSGALPWLRPDGKSQVTIEYSKGKPKRIDNVLISMVNIINKTNSQLSAVKPQRTRATKRATVPLTSKSLDGAFPPVSNNPAYSHAARASISATKPAKAQPPNMINAMPRGRAITVKNNRWRSMSISFAERGRSAVLAAQIPGWLLAALRGQSPATRSAGRPTRRKPLAR